METLIQIALDTCGKVRKQRTLHDVFLYMSEEIGELGTEINIKTGYSNKPVGKDGIVGEAIDAIFCLIDLIRLERPDITEAELIELGKPKLQKWFDKTEKQIADGNH